MIGRPLGKPLSEEESENQESSFSPRTLNVDKQSDISRLKSVLSSVPKGGLQGLFSLSNSMSMKNPEQVLSQIKSGKNQEEQQQEILDEILPTKPFGIEKGIQRGTKAATELAAFPGGAALWRRALLGGGAAQGVEEAGGGPGAQAVAELAAFGSPDFKKLIRANPQQKKLVEFARKMGLSEEEITPLIQSPRKGSFFGKYASKGQKTRQSLQNARSAVGGIYEQLKTSESAKNTLNPEQQKQFLQETYKLLMDLPSNVRKVLFQDYQDLMKTGFSGEGLINLWQDLSYYYGRGIRQAGGLKNPIRNALKNISPSLAEDFELTNRLFENRLRLSKQIRPKTLDNVLDLGEIGGFATAILKGSTSLLKKVLGVAAFRRLSREMVTNPRFQNLTQQMAEAASNNKLGIVKKTAEELMGMIKKDQEEEEGESTR